MFGSIDGGMVVLVALMVALGVVPGLLALSSNKARTIRLGQRMPQATSPAHRFHFGAATAARG